MGDLIEACSNALYEYEGIDKGVSRRSVQMDIQMMRSEKLGYNAPIIVLENKYYTYGDPNYSITNIPLTDQDLGKLTEVVEILRQFKGFSHFQELSGMVQRLENKIYAAKTNQEPVIDFEKNENLKGLEHIETLYQAIIKKCAVTLNYQSFKAREPRTFQFHPYYLKEYRNRWFVIGITMKNTPVMNLALDRIVSVSDCDVKYVHRQEFNLATHFNDVIGVTVNQNSRPEKVLLLFDRETAPYIITKPLHHSQEELETSPGGVLFSLNVQLNFELEREILGYGAHVKVVAPDRLKRRIKEIHEHAVDLYQYEFNAESLRNNLLKTTHKGYCVLHHVFARKEVNQIKQLVYNYTRSTGQKEDTYAIRNLLKEIPALKRHLFNTNLVKILKSIDPNLFLTKAIYFDKSPESNWYVTWHQDIVINVSEKVETEGYSGWTKKFGVHGVVPPEDILKNTFTVRIHLDDTNESNGALKVIPGSHKKKLSDEEIALIVQNSIPNVCDVEACGIQIMKPLILHASSKATVQKHRRVVHLEFCSTELPGGMEWAERMEVGEG
ncbi:MAG TPA: WYL domain-containing protein [Cyclobacteriaceae bacterium]|nr:WYL domain-containing protein [Cyclobacteriaceae bacterium]